MKITLARRLVLGLVFVAVIAGLIWNTGTGTPSSFGWQMVSTICPLGAFETFFASLFNSSWSFVPHLVIGLLLVAIVGIVLGKVFCAWVCPVPPIRNIFSFGWLRRLRGESTTPEGQPTDVVGAKATKSAKTEAIETAEAFAAKADEPGPQAAPPAAIEACKPEDKDLKDCPSGCTSCAEKRKKFDSRHVILSGALLSTAFFGFPVFCIICPVGLTFATLIAFWRLAGFNEPSWALLIFPAILVLEIFVLRKWCLKICPLGALMSLASIPNKLFRPRVEKSKCLREKGEDCNKCVEACGELLDPHYSEGMHECTKCGLCVDKCPVRAITIPFFKHTSVEKGK